MAASIDLKWGNIKGWSGFEKDSLAGVALQEYLDNINSISAMERQSDDQRQRICKVIDLIDGDIWNDWDGVKMTKDDAKEYVLSYGR